jgi:hypothetical protein
LFFDIEGLIVELHSEEYAAMSPTTLEVNVQCDCALRVVGHIFIVVEYCFLGTRTIDSTKSKYTQSIFRCGKENHR